MTITSSGIHLLGPFPRGSQACVQLSGAFTGATVAVGFRDGEDFHPFVPIGGSPVEFTSGAMIVVDVPYDGHVALNVTNTPDQIFARAWQANTVGSRNA